MAEEKISKKKPGCGCGALIGGVVVVCVILMIIGWIGNMAGCNKPTQTEVAPSGAHVDFVNAFTQPTGQSATLAPGTKLKWDHGISDTYAAYEVMSGPYSNRWARIERDKVTQR